MSEDEARFPMVPTLRATLGVKGHRPVVGTRDNKDLLYVFAVVNLVSAAVHATTLESPKGATKRTGKSKTAVWRWQERFASEGADGLLRDKTRPSGVAPFGPEVGERIVALTLAEPPCETTHWTGRAMAKASQAVLGGFTLRTDAKVVTFPARYMDPRGQAMWEQVFELLGR